MKKKIIYGLLLAVAMVTASSSFVSCKDYEGDDTAYLQNQVYSLEDLVAQQKTLIENCSTNCANQRQLLWDALDQVKTNLNTLTTKEKADSLLLRNLLNGLSTDLTALTAKEKADSLKLAQAINVLSTDLTALIAKEKADSLTLATAIANNTAAIGTLTNALNDLAAKEKADSLTLATAINENALAIVAATELAEQANTKADSALTKATENAEAIVTLTNNLTTLTNNFNTFVEGDFTDLKNDFTTLKNDYTKLKNDFTTLKNDFTTLQNNFTTLQSNFEQFYKAWGDDLASAIEEAARVRAIANTVAADSAAWNLAVEQAQAAVDTLAKYQDSWNETTRIVNESKAAWDNAVIQANEAWMFVQNDRGFKNLNELIAAYEEADKVLKDSIDALREQIKTVEEKLQKQIDKLNNTIAKQITGVIIQGTYSPVLGYGSLPVGLQLNVLAAYDGKNATGRDVKFPTANGGYYISNAVIKEADYEYLSGLGLWPSEIKLESGDAILSDAADNAGKVYLTVNPTNTDFEGTRFELVNSKGEETKVELSPLRPCDETLLFGWTRAAGVAEASASGLYVADAKIASENAASMHPHINKSVIKTAAENFVKQHNRASVKELAQAVYANMQNQFERNAVRATWMDETLNQERSYTSELALASAAITPLSFGFLKDINVPHTRYTQLPTINELIADSLHLNFDFDPSVFVINTDTTVHIWVEVLQTMLDPSIQIVYDVVKDENDEPILDENGNLQYGAYYDGYLVAYLPLPDGYDGSYYFASGLEVREGWVYIDITHLYKEIFGNLNDLIDALEPVGQLPDQVNGMIDNIIGKLNGYIDQYDRYATRINKFIDRIPYRVNQMVQPALLYQSSRGISRLSRSKNLPVSLKLNGQSKGQIRLLPTTYSLELLAPTYKKSLIVTNVYKDGKSAQTDGGELETALKAVNEQLKDYASFESVGISKAPVLTLDKAYAGMTFEIAYTAVDYSARVAGRKCYFKVVE